MNRDLGNEIDWGEGLVLFAGGWLCSLLLFGANHR
jgi:hypothetical protein